MDLSIAAVASIIFVVIALAGILVQLGKILEKVNSMDKNFEKKTDSMEKSFNEKLKSVEDKIKETENTHKECKGAHTNQLQSIRLERNERLDRLESKIDDYQKQSQAESDRFKVMVEGAIAHQNTKLSSVCEDLTAIRYRLQELDFKKASVSRIPAVMPPPISMTREDPRRER